jgi:hypothetical protein
MKAVKDSDDLVADPPTADASAGRRGARALRCRCQIVNGEMTFIWYVVGAGRLRSL